MTFDPIAYCGEDCSNCPAYIALVTDDQSLRIKTAHEWKRIEGVAPEHINCAGCKSQGPIFAHCSKCSIIPCCSEKGLRTCAQCPELERCVHYSRPSRKGSLERLLAMRHSWQ